jgi:hypothetical protein
LWESAREQSLNGQNAGDDVQRGFATLTNPFVARDEQIADGADKLRNIH